MGQHRDIMVVARRIGRPAARSGRGYSLGEMLAALVIGAMVLTAILGVYGRVQQASQAVIARMDTPALAAEVLQLIARDLDRTIGADGVTIEIRNGIDDGFSRAQLTLRQIYHDAQGNEQTLYQIIWQAARDYDSGAAGLVVYRSYEGVIPEDKLFEEHRRAGEQNYPFVPICKGVTYFRVDVPTEDRYVDQWSGTTLPVGVRVSLSLAEPYEAANGLRTVPEDEIQTRTVALDRTRVQRVDMPETGAGDANEPNAPATTMTSESNATRNTRR